MSTSDRRRRLVPAQPAGAPGSRVSPPPAGVSAQPYGLLALAGLPAFKAVLQQRAELERYHAQAEALGYSVRDAELVLAGVIHMAQRVMFAVDVFAEARQVLVRGEVRPI